MTTRTERDEAIPLVGAPFIVELIAFLLGEQKNLEGYAADPSSHADYVPYSIVDIAYLGKYATYLKSAIDRLDVIARYKQGDSEVTLSMHDNALDKIRSEIWEKLDELINQRLTLLNETFTKENLLFIGNYETTPGFDDTKYWDDVTVNLHARDGVRVVTQYASENEVQPGPAPTGLTGVGTTSPGVFDGQIIGVDTTMEYSKMDSQAPVWTAVTGTEIINLGAGNYQVRIMGVVEEGIPASQSAIVTIEERR